MTKIPDWFPKSTEEMYRMGPLQQPTIDHPQVAESHGGGACPEQHWGVLADGRVFYFRMRHGWASLCLGPDWYEAGALPVMDPRVDYDAWMVLAAASPPDAELPSLWLGPRSGVGVSDEDDGWFPGTEDQTPAEQRAEAFGKCLDQVWDQPFDPEGWEPFRGNIPRRKR